MTRIAVRARFPCLPTTQLTSLPSPCHVTAACPMACTHCLAHPHRGAMRAPWRTLPAFGQSHHRLVFIPDVQRQKQTQKQTHAHKTVSLHGLLGSFIPWDLSTGPAPLRRGLRVLIRSGTLLGRPLTPIPTTARWHSVSICVASSNSRRELSRADRNKELDSERVGSMIRSLWCSKTMSYKRKHSVLGGAEGRG